jgi:hypothetical protein
MKGAKLLSQLALKHSVAEQCLTTTSASPMSSAGISAMRISDLLGNDANPKKAAVPRAARSNTFFVVMTEEEDDDDVSIAWWWLLS